VEWCLSLQEAALYLPYPEPLLNLTHFAVQVDAGGRLVFRGPRFKMGLCEGVPKTITPDHQGRADYHGAFVNQAARYADAAAHGGQVVTDVDLAVKVLQLWRLSSSSSLGFSGPGGQAIADLRSGLRDGDGMGVGAADEGNSGSPSYGGRWVGGLLPGSPAEAYAAAAAATGGGGGGSGGPEGFFGGALDGSDALNTTLTRRTTPAAATAAAAAVTEDNSLGYSHSEEADELDELPLVPGSTVAVPVEAVWLGSYLFKGNPNPVEMVGFSPAVLMGRSYPAGSPKGKGMRVVQRVGGMDRAVVQLPAVMEGSAAAASAAAASAAAGGGGGAVTRLSAA
jgi:hypothetical protein